MRVIIAGSRGITDYAIVEDAVRAAGLPITEIVSGRARGVDALGERYALKCGIPLKFFPAYWSQHGKGAGFIRNQEMAEYAEALIVVWDGYSKGTADMINKAIERRLKVFIQLA